MNLDEYVGKRIKVTTNNKNVYIGNVVGFTQALDNEPEIDEIDIKNESDNILYGLLENEIISIEIIE